MAYGTPATPADVEAYYTHVRRGRPPAPEQLDDLRRRYGAIGGTSPLLERTRAQVRGVARALGDGYRVTLGMKHAPPFVEDAVRDLEASGVQLIVGLVLAPHYSALSVGEYLERAKATAGRGTAMRFVESWHLETGYLDLLVSYARDALDTLPAGSTLLVTAHSLPARVLELRDPYPAQVRETAAALAARLGHDPWRVAWQSAGRTPDPWLTPDLLSVLRDLAGERAPGVAVCPAGFVSDHLEILYDLDVEAAALARDLGLPFERTRMPNDDAAFCAALARVVREQVDG
jgi:ferrochelatase